MADKSLLNMLRIRATDEEVWRTINNAKVLIDGDDGTIKGGMGGKWNGKKFKPSWGKNAKTGKKVLKPWKGKFTHFKGTKKDLLEKLKKAAEPPKKKKHYNEVYEEYNKLNKQQHKMAEATTQEELDAAYNNWQAQFEEYEKSYADLDTDAMNHDDMTNSLAEYVLLQKDHLKDIDFTALDNYLEMKKKIQVKEATTKAKEAWAKVVKAKNALKDAKSLNAKLGNQLKMAAAFSEYNQAVQGSPGKIDFKPNIGVVQQILSLKGEDLANFGHKKKGEASTSPAGKVYPQAGKVNQFITPTTTGSSNRQANIQNTIEVLKQLAEAAQNHKSKYQMVQLKHAGKDGWKATPLPAKSEDKQVHQKLIGECGNVWKQSSDDEKKAITEYTGSYSKYNEPLRGIEYGTSKFKGVGNIDMDMIGVGGYGNFKKGQVKKLINEMTDIIDKSSYNFDVQVRRGVSVDGAAKLLGIDSGLFYGSEEDLKNAVEGKLCTEFGFSSCGAAEGKGFTRPIELRILCPAGTKMMYAEPFSHYGHGSTGTDWKGEDEHAILGGEQEVILQRNTRFQVQRAHKVNGKWQIELQVIAQDPVQFN